MKDTRPVQRIIENNLVLLGIGLGVIYWVLESALAVFVVNMGTFVERILTPDLNEIWRRSLVVGFLITFSVYAQIMINTQKRAEEATNLAYAELNQIFNTAVDGMWVIDKEFTVLRINETFSMLSGLSKDEGGDKKCYEVFRGPFCQTPNCSLIRILGGEERVEVDVEKERNDGLRIPCIVTATPFRTLGGELIGIVEAFKDISERKRAEEALQKYNKVLEESNHLKGLMTDILSHDLLNPAGVVKTSSEILLERETNIEKRKFLELIKNATSNLIERIENAAKYSKLELIERIECSRLDLNTILRKTIREFEYQLEEKQIHVDYLPEGEYPAWANAMLSEVFLNLISNAIKYSPPGSRIELDIQERSDDKWVVSVKDFGEGIPEKNKAKLFTRFERLDKENVKGTGLGLAIAKRIVELHSGHIWVEDNPNGGSIFYVSLRKESPVKSEEGQAG